MKKGTLPLVLYSLQYRLFHKIIVYWGELLGGALRKRCPGKYTAECCVMQQCVQELADIIDLQVTGPEAELKSLEESLAGFNPTYFYEV